jgi:hypothetical protein
MSMAAAAAAIANAIKASGVVVRVSPKDFYQILALAEEPLVVMAQGGFFQQTHHYLTSYKGLAFFTKSVEAIRFPGPVELVTARKIWIPG